MAPIIAKTETALEIKFQVKRAEIEISSYVDDLQSGIYIWEPDVAKSCEMGEMLREADVEVDRIAAENRLPLEESKHEQLVLRMKKRRRSADVKWVKWVGVIMDESLTFDKHWQSSIQAVAMWGAELGWRGQKRWEQKVIDLQCQALSKCVNAVRGARKELVCEITGVESPRMALDAAQSRLLEK